MIAKLLAFTDAGGRRMLHRLLGLTAVTAVLEGVAFALLLPILGALFSPTPGDAWPWLAGLVGLMLGYAGLYLAGTRTGYAYGTLLLRTAHRRLGDRIAALPVGYFDVDRSGPLGRLASRGTVFMASAPAHLVRAVIGGFVTPATVLIVLAVVQWQLGAALLVAVPLLWLGFRATAGLIGRRDVALQRTIGESGSRIIEFAREQPALRAFGRAGGDGAADTPLRRALDGQRHTYAGLLWAGGGGIALYGVIVQLVVTAALAVGTALALGGTVGVAEAAALLILVVRFAEPLTIAGSLGAGIRVSENSLDEVLALMRVPQLPEPADAGDGAVQRVPADRAEIELRDVRFGYRAGETVLDGVDFRVPAGTMTAIVGPSGSGKSTVLRLISRFYDTDDGAVLIGGSDVRHLGTAAVMTSISQVFQQVYLFEGTLRDNVLVGRPDATDEQVARATRLARVDEIADRLPGGWSAPVGEGGSRLSGGEQQRVSIARAILKDAPIVLLDEATASLDPENEAAVTEALGALAGRRTLIVVAHRLQTVMNADQIVVLRADGQVAEIGSHTELLDQKGPYARFWAERTHAAGWHLAGV